MTRNTDASFSPVLCWCGMGVQITLNEDGSLGVMVALANGQRLHTSDRQQIAPDEKRASGLSYTMLVLPDPAHAKRMPEQRRAARSTGRKAARPARNAQTAAQRA